MDVAEFVFNSDDGDNGDQDDGIGGLLLGGKTGEYEKAKLLIWGENRSHLESQRVKYL